MFKKLDAHLLECREENEDCLPMLAATLRTGGMKDWTKRFAQLKR